MFSDKEYILIGGVGIGVSFCYFILRISIPLTSALGGMIDWVLSYVRIMQSLVIIPFAILTVLHIRMLYEARKFMDDKLKEGFKDSYKLLYWSETITVVIVLTLLFGLLDLPYYISAWKLDPIRALKLSFYPYWWYEAYLTSYSLTSYQYAVVWYYPLFLFSLIFEIITYKKYFFAKSIYCHLHPSVPCSDIYNAFSTRRRNKNPHSLVVPKDELENIEVPPCEAIPQKEKKQTDPSSPLGKNLGNNTLYVVDENLLPQHKNAFKTQAELDAEEGGFFSGEETVYNMMFFAKRKKEAELNKKEKDASVIDANLSGKKEETIPAVSPQPKEEPLDQEIPLDFDYQSFYRSKNRSADKEKETDSPFQQSPSVNGSTDTAPAQSGNALDDEISLDFDYQSFYKVKDKKEEKDKKKEESNLISCPFCGTLNAGDREECIFCGAALSEG